jgi:hypothetical protein
MPTEIAGLPHWELGFDEDGDRTDPAAAGRLAAEVAAAGVTDLFVFSHGWNNDLPRARRLYERFFTQLAQVAKAQGVGAKIGTVGVIWPSMRWTDEAEPAGEGGVSLGDRPSDPELAAGLKAVFTKPAQRAAIDELTALLIERPRDEEALARFQRSSAALVRRGNRVAPEDRGELAILTGDPVTIYGQFAALAGEEGGEGGAMGIGDRFTKLWKGAKEALRALTYFEMKRRAGTVGQRGLAPVLLTLPGVRIHLIGHSFGARLVSFALLGLPAGAASPVKSLALVQGAFSHFAFAPSLPGKPGKKGALAGFQDRVDGPLLATFTEHDQAVGRAYPLASILSQDNASAAEDRLFEWGAVGHDGFQRVGAGALTLQPVGKAYDGLRPAGFANLDSNAVIRNGAPPFGAHSDIVHPEVAWAVLSGAGLGRRV